MTRPDLDALAVLIVKNPHDGADAAQALLALPALLAYVRELERDNADLRHDIERAQDTNAELATAERAAAIAMRERAAQACERLSAEWFPRDRHDAAREGALMCCAAAVRALEV